MAFSRFPVYRRERMGGFLVLLGLHRNGRNYDAWSQSEGLVPADHGYVLRMTTKVEKSAVPSWLREKFETTEILKGNKPSAKLKRLNPSKKRTLSSEAIRLQHFLEQNGFRVIKAGGVVGSDGKKSDAEAMAKRIKSEKTRKNPGYYAGLKGR